MANFNRTYRIVDGERIEGSWRHVFIKNGMYFLSDLKIYADGMIDCWGLVDLATFREKVASGWIATTFSQGARASIHHLVTWKFDESEVWLTPEQLIAEVADEIELLAGRPTTKDKCLTALDSYLDEPTDERLTVLRDAYFAVPGHLRLYILSDQDSKDIPLRMLITPIGDPLYPEFPGVYEEPVKQSDHDTAWEYFRRRREDEKRWETEPMPWQDDPAPRSPSVARFDKHDGGHPYLANEYLAPIAIAEGTFPSVEHAFWALATTDADARDRIVGAPRGLDARKIGQSAPLRSDWNVVRLAVMLRLVREKFRQHPDLAEKLLATGDGRLINGVELSQHWGAMEQGRNWLGRILEIVRAELVLENS
ncbi:MAG TPA: NADAR family protein [Ktedonobacterales bacterium]|jgi:ribA/ribD-fused uncharacterized protein